MKIEDRIKQNTFKSNLMKAVLNLKLTSYWYGLKEASIFKDYDILAQHYNIMRIVNGSHPKPMSPSKILEVMLNPGRDLTRLVDKLVKKGLFVRKTSTENRRSVDISITEAGIKLTEQISKDVDEFLIGFNGLTEEEAQQLSDLLDKLRNV